MMILVSVQLTAQCVELEFLEKVVALASVTMLVARSGRHADIVYDAWKALSDYGSPRRARWA